MKIGIDVDGVLANFGDGFAQFGRTLFGNDKFPKNYVPRDWNWTDVITMDEQMFMWKELKHVNNFWLSLKPFEENMDALYDFLKEYGKIHDVWFVTARAASGGDTQAAQTAEWLARELGDANGLHRGVVVTAKPALKSQILEGMDITYMIDDNGPTIESLDTLPNMNAFLLDSPWNQDAKVNNRVASLPEFLERIGEPVVA